MARLSADERRGALVQAALRVIDRDGVPGATTRAIVAEAGMALASFHYVFDSRDELIRAVIAHVIEVEGAAAADSMGAVPESEGAPIGDIVRAGLRGYLGHLAERPGHEQAMFELFHYALRTPELADLPAGQYAAYRELAAHTLTEGARRAGIRWAVPVADLARVLVTATDGLSLAWLADRDTAAAERAIDIIADMIVAAALPGGSP